MPAGVWAMPARSIKGRQQPQSGERLPTHRPANGNRAPALRRSGNTAAAWAIVQGIAARERAGYTPTRSTSNTSVAFGGITPPAPRAP